MARRTVRIDLPIGKPDELIQLGLAILTGSSKAGDKCPVNVDKLGKLKQVLEVAIENNSNAKSFDAQGQTARQIRDVSLGIAKGQTATTPDTALNLMMHVRDQLLLAYEGNEDVLEQYGFDVVIGTAKSPSRNHAAAPATT
jgi:hypothetical protein